MIIDFKETIWYRIPIDSTLIDKESLIKAFNNNEINTSEELLDYILNETEEIVTGEYLPETSDKLSVEDNHNHSTIEFYDDNGKLIYHNGKLNGQ